MKSDKKAKLIEAAIEAFNEKGLEHTKIADIVKLAGVAQGTYYLYFSSKLAIMPAIAEVVVERILTDLKETLDTRRSYSYQLEQLIEVSFSITKQYADVIALTYAGLASSEYLTEWETIYEPYYLYVTEFIKQGIATGEMTSEMEPKVVARLLIGLIETSGEQLFLYGESNQEMIVEQKSEVLSFALRALGMNK